MFKTLIAALVAAVSVSAEPVVLTSENFRELVNDGSKNLA